MSTGLVYFPGTRHTNSSKGKSSVINSLLDVQNIALQIDGGKACTSVVQEFHNPCADQQTACEGEIFFLSPAAREALLKEWLKNISLLNHSDDDPDDALLEEQYDTASSTAVDGLFSLFCDHDQCDSPEAVQEFFTQSVARDDPATILMLDDLLNRLGVGVGKLSISAEGPEDFQGKVAPYFEHVSTYSGDGRLKPCPWPLVKLVK